MALVTTVTPGLDTPSSGVGAGVGYVRCVRGVVIGLAPGLSYEPRGGHSAAHPDEMPFRLGSIVKNYW